MRRELEVCRFLSEHDAPIIPPTFEVNAGPYRIGKFVLTYWTFVKPLRNEHRKKEIGLILEALGKCHAALRDYPRPLPSFQRTIEACLLSFRRGHAKNFLAKEDFSFLSRIHAVLWQALKTFSFLEQPLHGDAHWGNAVRTKQGYLWTDFESVCRGPIEWDLAALPESITWKDADPDLLDLLRHLRSWCVAVWCWSAYDGSEEKKEAAHFHLTRLKKAFSAQLRK